ncbi:unnamed protein product [Litomosoides sigmodontis]|uniref:Uncharacterized protein n=1 Tax=Litomosoides sigmodontis TaxID=42156 RepID=A0A3P6T649_LITSI|nr:unnamed protein product [Litomosoides sigmodontis]
MWLNLNSLQLPELDNLPSSASFIPSMTAHFVNNEQRNYVNGHDVSHEANLNVGNIRSTPDTVVDVGDEHNQQSQFTARKSTSLNENSYTATSSLLIANDRDEDLPENKYKRRSASEWLNRWFRSRYGKRTVFDPRAQWKRGIFYIIICIIVVMTVFTVLSQLMNNRSNDDPEFNPLANPNIRVALPEYSQ